MNQIAASILVLSASILGYAATVRSDTEGFGGLLGLIAIGLGLWGCMGLLTSSLRDQQLPWEEDHASPTRSGVSPLGTLQNLTYPGPRSVGSLGQSYHVSADTNARLSAAAQLRGQNRQEVVDEILRRHLPGGHNSSSAA